MAIRLDDNERGAFNYLVGGVAAVLLLKGAAWAVETLGPGYSPEGAVLRPFQHGYWGMRNELVVAGGSADLAERLMAALVAPVAAAFLVALVLAAVARARGRSGGRTARLATRAVLLLGTLWFTYAAFCVPPREARVEAGRLVLRQRPALAGMLALPFPAREVRLGRPAVDRITARELRTPGNDAGAVALEFFPAGQDAPGRIALRNGIAGTGRLEALREGSEAAALLERNLQ